MDSEKDQKALKVCATCPFLKCNHGKRHQAGWYTIANLKRLWNGLRSGKAPGMICHSTDPKAATYGGDPKRVGMQAKECAGALNLIIKHVNEANAIGTIKDYQQRHKTPITKRGFGHWIERHVFGGIPHVENRSDDVGLPWES